MLDQSQSGILFVCIGNSCRSPMAEAICRHLAGERVAAFSAGVAPVGEVSHGAVEALSRHGISAGGLRSKHVDEVPLELVGLVVCLDAAYTAERVLDPDVPVRYENWDIPDPIGGGMEDYERTFEVLRERISDLLKREGLL